MGENTIAEPAQARRDKTFDGREIALPARTPRQLGNEFTPTNRIQSTIQYAFAVKSSQRSLGSLRVVLCGNTGRADMRLHSLAGAEQSSGRQELRAKREPIGSNCFRRNRSRGSLGSADHHGLLADDVRYAAGHTLTWLHTWQDQRAGHALGVPAPFTSVAVTKELRI